MTHLLATVNSLRQGRWFAAWCAAVCLTLLAVPAWAENWTDSSGKFQVDAEFLGIRGTDVYLKRADGVTIKVPLVRLSATSQELARRLALAAAPPAAADDTPDATARALQANLEAGNMRAVWDALPSSYQRDVHGLVHTFAANMDADVWKAGTDLLRKAVRVLKEKKEFLLKQPLLAQGPVNASAMADNWDPIVSILETLATSDLADLEKLKTLDLGAFLDGTGKQIAEQAAALARAAEGQPLELTEFPAMPVEAMPLAGIASAKFSTVQIQGDSATLRIENEDGTEDQEVVRVDGKWLPKEMVDKWSEQMETARTALTTTMPENLKKNKMQIVAPMQMIQAVLDQLLAAKTQEEFDQVIQQVMQMFMPQGLGEPPAGDAPGDAPGGADPFGG